jgi:hypothetical protein
LITADVSAGPRTPRPPALLTVNIDQHDPGSPNQHAVPATFNLQREFGASNVLRVDFVIALN